MPLIYSRTETIVTKREYIGIDFKSSPKYIIDKMDGIPRTLTKTLDLLDKKLIFILCDAYICYHPTQLPQF